MWRSHLDAAEGHGGPAYRVEKGEIEVDSVEQIAIQDITHQLAIESGFLGVIDLLKVAKHGPGDNVYLIRFHYVPSFRKALAALVLAGWPRSVIEIHLTALCLPTAWVVLRRTGSN